MRDITVTMAAALGLAVLASAICYLLLPGDPLAVYFPVVPFYVPITPN